MLSPWEIAQGQGDNTGRVVITNPPASVPGGREQRTPTNAPISTTIIPGVSWPSGTGVVSSSQINSVAGTQPRVWQVANVAAIGQVIRLVYGMYQLGAAYLGNTKIGSTIIYAVAWCDACEGVQALLTNNGDALPSSVVVRHYNGSQTAPDARLKQGYEAEGKPFNHNIDGICYSVLEFSTSVDFDPSGIIATIKGLRVFDPRDESQSRDDPATWTWSDNAALCLADFLSSADHGFGKQVDWDSVIDAANFCDEILGSGETAQRRRTLNWAITERQSTISLIEVMRSYAGCWVVSEAGILKLIPDRVADVDFTLTAADLDGVPRIRVRGTSEKPTVVRLIYTDTTESLWKDGEAYDPDPVEDGWDGLGEIVESTVQMPGINSFSAARREARERRLKLILCDHDITANVKDIGVRIKPGHIVRIPHPAFPNGKPFRVKSPPVMTAPARYQLDGEEYQPPSYSNDVFPEPDYPDTTLPDPSNVPPVENLRLEERLVRHKDGSVTSQIVARWDAAPTDWPYDVEWLVEFSSDGTLIAPMQTVYSPQYLSPDVEEGKTYAVRVATKCRGFTSAWGADIITAVGKQLPPSDVPGWIRHYEVAGDVYLTWLPAYDIDLTGYEIRRAVNDSDINFAAISQEEADALWASGALVDILNSLDKVATLQPVGTWIYMVKAVDSVGNRSPWPLCARVTVTTDDAARFVDTHYFRPLTLTNMALEIREPLLKRFWISDCGEPLGFGHANPDDDTGTFADLADAPFLLPHDTGFCQWVSEPWDLGREVAGTWVADASVRDYDGKSEIIVELSNDLDEWIPHPGGSAAGQARYSRVRIRTAGAMTVADDVRITLSAIPRTETGTQLVGDEGVYRVSLRDRYSKYLSIRVSPVTSQPWRAVYDNVVVGADKTASFDIYLFDENNQRVTGNVDWIFEGI